MTHNAEFQAEKVIPSLIGGIIIEAFTDKDKEFFGFTVKKGKKTLKVWVDGDEEGNYCGALKVEDEGRKVKKQ